MLVVAIVAAYLSTFFQPMVWGTAEQKRMTDQVLAAFEARGADFPALIIRFSCPGEPDYRRGAHYDRVFLSEIRVCDNDAGTLSHELGHALAEYADSRTRDYLIDLYGGETWEDNAQEQIATDIDYSVRFGQSLGGAGLFLDKAPFVGSICKK